MGRKASQDVSTYRLVPLPRVVQLARGKPISVMPSSIRKLDTTPRFFIGFGIGRVPSFLEPVLLFKQADERRNELEQRNGEGEPHALALFRSTMSHQAKAPTAARPPRACWNSSPSAT